MPTKSNPIFSVPAIQFSITCSQPQCKFSISTSSQFMLINLKCCISKLSNEYLIFISKIEPVASRYINLRFPTTRAGTMTLFKHLKGGRNARYWSPRSLPSHLKLDQSLANEDDNRVLAGHVRTSLAEDRCSLWGATENRDVRFQIHDPVSLLVFCPFHVGGREKEIIVLRHLQLERPNTKENPKNVGTFISS